MNKEIKVRSILQQALDDLNTLASAKKGEEIYIDQIEAKAQALLEHIADLQRKGYNNSKAIEYITSEETINMFNSINGREKWLKINHKLLNTLEKGE